MSPLYMCVLWMDTEDRKVLSQLFQISDCWALLKSRFGLSYLQKDLYAWILDNAICFETALSFKPLGGAQIFMRVDEDFWKNLLSGEEPSQSEEVQQKSLITLSHEETQSILAGEQCYLLRSQRVSQSGRVLLAVKSLNFAVLGSVEFGENLEFKSSRAFQRWDGYKDCSPSDLGDQSNITKRLQSNKPVYAITLRNPEPAEESMYWISTDSCFKPSRHTRHKNSWKMGIDNFSIFLETVYIYMCVHMIWVSNIDQKLFIGFGLLPRRGICHRKFGMYTQMTSGLLNSNLDFWKVLHIYGWHVESNPKKDMPAKFSFIFVIHFCFSLAYVISVFLGCLAQAPGGAPMVEGKET